MAAGADVQNLIGLAGQLDAAGRHAEALNALLQAGRSGSVRAKAMLGARLLTGDRAPPRPDQGMMILAEAGAQGDGPAAEVMAATAALGFLRPRNWTEALDWLVRAAESGGGRARGVLGVLCRDAALAAAAGDPQADAGLWKRLRARIDPGALAVAPEGRTIHDDPLIRSFPAFATAAECDWLIGRSQGRLSRAQVYNAVTQEVQAHETRTNTAANFGLLDVDLVQIVVQARIAAATGIPQSHLEAPAVLHYAIGEQITEHFDFVDPATPDHDAQVARDGQRMVTFLVYLNDGYEGGETEFPRLGVSHKGEKGEGMFFVNSLEGGKADVRTVHAGRPPRGGEKWIVSQFIRSRPTVPGAAPAAFAHPAPR